MRRVSSLRSRARCRSLALLPVVGGRIGLALNLAMPGQSGKIMLVAIGPRNKSEGRSGSKEWTTLGAQLLATTEREFGVCSKGLKRIDYFS
jgi:hypothetical protein